LLRKRAGIQDNGKGKLHAQDEDHLIPEAVRASVANQGDTAVLSSNVTNKGPSLTSRGHINLFADIEEVCKDSRVLIPIDGDLDI
jgi:hypothetical protein